jgi:uncharacterized membrane protein YfcA
MRTRTILATLALLFALSQARPCDIDADCENNYYSCSQYGECIHKFLFPHIFSMEIVGGFVLMVIIGMAAASGIGGGGLVMPIVIIFFGFYAPEAVPLSNFSILTAAVLRFIMNFSQKHPEREERTSIDYDTVLCLMPMVLLGSMMGVLLNKILPSLVVIVGLTAILAFMSFKTTKRYFTVAKKEKEKMAKDKAAASDP